jgi:cytochrome P450
MLRAASRSALESDAVRETSREPDRDLKSWRNVQDPFPLYAWLRDQAPVHWSESLKAWVVTRYADVVEIFNRPEAFSSDRFRKIDERYASHRPAARAVADVLGRWLVFRDPPDRGPSTHCSTASWSAAQWTSSASSPSPSRRSSSPD